MLRTLNILIVLLFCAFLVLPLGLLAGLGTVAPYGQKDFIPYPQPKKLLHGSPKARKALSSALFERSAATYFAIRTHNAVQYRLIGTVDNDRMVTGEGGWLFLKEEFWEGKCIPDEVLATTLRMIDTVAALSAAAGLPLLVSVSPDKTTIHPEKLGTRASVYAGCKILNGRRWRELARRHAPHLIDHATAIPDPRNPRVPYFFAFDSHWNSRAQALAVNQLVAALEGGRRTPPLLYADDPYIRVSDLLTNMLLLDGQEPDQAVTSFPAPRVGARPLVFITDSFYGGARGELERAFPHSEFFHLVSDRDAYSRTLQTLTGQLVVDFVERSLFSHFHDWDSPLPHAILKRNMTKAETCTFAQSVDLASLARLFNIEPTGDSHYRATTDDPILIVPIPEKADCVRIAIDLDEAGLFQMFLPILEGRDDHDHFAEGREISLHLPAGTSVLNFLLPTDRKGQELRIDPVNQSRPFTLSEVKFGWLR